MVVSVKDNPHALVVQRLKRHVHAFVEGAGLRGIAEWEPVVFVGYPSEGEMQKPPEFWGHPDMKLGVV